MDLKAFKNSVFPIQGKLFRFAKTMLQNEEEAEDAVQEAFLKLWQNRQSLNTYRSVEALAVIITKNLCLDRLKSSRYKRTVSADQIDTDKAQASPYENMEMSDHATIVRHIMSRLPEQQRMIIHLRDVEEYSFEEIEKITGMCLNNIRVTLSRARKSVREAFMKIDAYGN